MEIYVIRHTRVSIDSGICYGQSDVDLAQTFEQELGMYKSCLPSDFDKVYSSPLKRCHLLADALSPDNVMTDNRLMEMNFGDWELKSWSEIDSPDARNWMDNYTDVSAPNGESMQDLFNRVKEFYQLVKNENETKILMVTHAGVIRCLWALLLDIPLHNAFKIPVGFGETLLIDGV